MGSLAGMLSTVHLSMITNTDFGLLGRPSRGDAEQQRGLTGSHIPYPRSPLAAHVSASSEMGVRALSLQHRHGKAHEFDHGSLTQRPRELSDSIVGELEGELKFCQESCHSSFRSFPKRN